MVVASPLPVRQERVRAIGVPVVDLRGMRAEEEMVRACEEFGFFKVVNHGVREEVVAAMEAAAVGFFGLPSEEKERAGPPSPLGYGIRSIGLKGDTGEVEYLLLPADTAALSQRASSVCPSDPQLFSGVVTEYVDAVRGLAEDILQRIGGGLRLQDPSVFARLACNEESDSLLRLNYYPFSVEEKEREEMKEAQRLSTAKGEAVVVGFGEHTDPQVLTVLRSNDAPGLQVLYPPDADGGGGVWVPVAPDPSAFFILVGDVLQAMTNGRLLSARHRAVVSNVRSRLSTVFFAAPPLQASIAPLREMVGSRRCGLYKPFTWGEYKKAMYALRLGHNRLDFFRQDQDDGQEQTAPISS